MTIEPSEPNLNPLYDPEAPVRTLLVDVFTASDAHVLRVTGELDLATHGQLVSASTAGNHSSIVIDLGGVTFMDCSGYGALVASRQVIEGEGRSVTITGQTGQPARLLDLIAELEHSLRAVRDGADPVSAGWAD